MSDTFQTFLLLSIGSILGANIRMEIMDRFKNKYFIKGSDIMFINLIASFILGFVVGLYEKNFYLINNNNFILFFNIGFLGSFSTFSSFLFQIFMKVRARKIFDAFYIAFLTIFSGLLLAYFGYKASNAI
tara:strand:+ start:303 stop:692 length:390 start_codon:yes stop_codon:yes gene_type:complete